MDGRGRQAAKAPALAIGMDAAATFAMEFSHFEKKADKNL